MDDKKLILPIVEQQVVGASMSSHRSESSSFHVEDMVVTRAVFAALLCYHHELLSS